MHIRPVEAELFRAGGRTDMRKLTVVFRKFATAPKTPAHILYTAELSRTESPPRTTNTPNCETSIVFDPFRKIQSRVTLPNTEQYGREGQILCTTYPPPPRTSLRNWTCKANSVCLSYHPWFVIRHVQWVLGHCINLFPHLCNNTFKRADNPRLRNNQMTYELYSTFIFSLNFVDLLCSFFVRRVWEW
jgi:hypothetical protein